jgi:anti-anti-sigma factor
VAAPEVLTWHVGIRDRRAELKLAGDLDIAAGNSLIDAVSAIADLADAVTIDMRAVTFLDGGGLDALMRVAQVLADSGVAVTYGATAPKIDWYLDLTGEQLERI